MSRLSILFPFLFMIVQSICAQTTIGPSNHQICCQSRAKSSLTYVSKFANRMNSSRPIKLYTPKAIFAASLPPQPEDTTKVKKPGSVLGAALGGILGGVVGFAGGAVIGLYADDCYKHGGESSLFCNFDTGLVVGSATGAVLLATGVHLGNGRHGQFKSDLLVSVLIGGVGLGAALGAKSPVILFSVPVVQLIGTVYMERRKTPAR
jgi:hypothetical protein